MKSRRVISAPSSGNFPGVLLVLTRSSPLVEAIIGREYRANDGAILWQGVSGQGTESLCPLFHGAGGKDAGAVNFNDVDKDGRITFGEFLRFMADLDPEMSREECEFGFGEIDADSDGAIDFEELVELSWALDFQGERKNVTARR